jgi:hypothetical protein
MHPSSSGLYIPPQRRPGYTGAPVTAAAPAVPPQGPKPRSSQLRCSPALVAASPVVYRPRRPATPPTCCDPALLYQNTLKAIALTEHRISLWREHTLYTYDMWKLSCGLFSKGLIDHSSLAQNEQDLSNAKSEVQRQQTTLRGLQHEASRLLAFYPDLDPNKPKADASPDKPAFCAVVGCKASPCLAGH